MRSSYTSMSAANAAPPRSGSSRPPLAGVLYAEDFDEDATATSSAPEPEPELIEPVFTAVELDTARAEGRANGLAEAERGVAASRVQVLRLIADGMSEAREGARTIAGQAAEATARCILTALASCLPSLCSVHGAEEMRAMIRTVLPALTNEPRITVRVHPHMVPVLEDEIATLDFEIAERVAVHPSEAIAPGDARVSWSEGSAGRNAARARLAVEEALAMLGLLERHTLQPETIDA